MVIPDINLLVIAYNTGAMGHERAREWWQSLMDGDQSVGLAWAVILGYVRVMTNRSVLPRPLTPAAALDDVRAWLAMPHVVLVMPGTRHLEIVSGLFEASGASGRLTTDIHLAALAIEHQAEIHTNDADFSRFPGLRHDDPLR